MKFKDGVITEATVYRNGKKKRVKVSTETEIALEAADALSKAIAGTEIVVTSLLDGKHRIDSKHYEGNAGDIRRWIYKSHHLYQIEQNLRQNLGPKYDVVLEATHLHIEFDPK